jgi:hypothetical protein
MRTHRDCTHTWLIWGVSPLLSVDVLAHICALNSQANFRSPLSYYNFIERHANISVGFCFLLITICVRHFCSYENS